MLRRLFLFATCTLLACSTDDFSSTSDSGANRDAADAADAADAPSAPVTFRGSSNAARTPTTMKFSAPGTAVAGDTLIALIGRDPNLPFTAPAGFTLVAGEATGGKCGAIFRAEVYTATFTGTDVTFTGSPGAMGDIAADGLLLGYAGTDESHVQNAQATAQDSTAVFTVDAIASTFAGSSVIAAVLDDLPLDVGPVGMTERGSFSSKRGWAFDLSLPNGGAVPARTFSTLNKANACGMVFQIVLKPK